MTDINSYMQAVGQRARAAALRERIVTSGVSKYNVGEVRAVAAARGARRVVLALPAPAAAEQAPAYAALSVGAVYHFNFGSGGAIVMRLEEKTPERSLWAIVPGQEPAGAGMPVSGDEGPAD